MNKLLSAALLLYSTFVYAENTTNTLGINVGLVSIYNDSSIELDQFDMGITYQMDEVNTAVKPRFDLDYVKVSSYKDVTSFVKVSANGVYEFLPYSTVSPYLIGGIGYEVVNGGIINELDSRAFAQGGAGAIYHGDMYDFNVEMKVLQTLGSDLQDNEVILTAGVSMPVTALFTKQSVAPIAPVSNSECAVKIEGPDEDRDGIEDSVDQCPNTPCYFSVDRFGCPVKATLRTHFEVNRAIIRPYSLNKIQKFSKFLRENKGSYVKVIGYTDSDGSENYNMLLSQKRANAVMEQMIDYGVSRQRLSAEGKGESMPIATNQTDAGKTLNRRIEVELSYPQN